MKFNILHYVLLLYSLRTLRPLISFIPETRSILFPHPSRQHVQFSLYVHLHSVLSLHTCSTKYMIHQLTSNCNYPWNTVALTCIHRQQVLIIPWKQHLCHKQIQNALFHFPSKHGKVSCRGIILISCSPDKYLQTSTFDMLYCCLVIMR